MLYSLSVYLYLHWNLFQDDTALITVVGVHGLAPTLLQNQSFWNEASLLKPLSLIEITLSPEIRVEFMIELKHIIINSKFMLDLLSINLAKLEYAAYSFFENFMNTEYRIISFLKMNDYQILNSTIRSQLFEYRILTIK